uniref:Type II secretion system F family protein n=1 Tax=Schlesneria paludicola TaxID=360056 RepID=A0A7C2K165_9PLAN
MWIDLITLTAFLATFLTALLFGMAALRARRRLRNIADVGDRMRLERPSPMRRALAGAIPVFQGEWEALSQDLRRAGYYGADAAVEYLAARNFISLGTLIAGGVAAVIADPNTPLPRTLLLAAAAVSVLTYVVPRAILHRQACSRLHRIQQGLPDALDIIRMCLAGGLPLREALERVSRDIEFFHRDIAVELEVVRRHAEADTMQKALKEFSRRMNAPDVNALSSLVSQTELNGTHVATAVTEFADTMRRQYRQRVEERANKTSIAMLFPVILCLAPPVFILLVGPPVLQLRSFIHDAHQTGGVLDTGSYAERALPVTDLDDLR